MHHRVADFARAACHVAAVTFVLAFVPYTMLLLKLEHPDMIEWRWIHLVTGLSSIAWAILLVVKLGSFLPPGNRCVQNWDLLFLHVWRWMMMTTGIQLIIYQLANGASDSWSLILFPMYCAEVWTAWFGLGTIFGYVAAPQDGFHFSCASILAWRLASGLHGAYRFAFLWLVAARLQSSLKSGYWILLPTTANGVAAVLHRAVRCVVTPGPNSPDFPVSSLQYRFAHLVFAILREVQIFAALFAVVTYAEGGCTGFSILTLGVVFPFTFVAPYMICLYCILIPAARGIAPVKEPLIEDLLWLPHWLLLVDMQTQLQVLPRSHRELAPRSPRAPFRRRLRSPLRCFLRRRTNHRCSDSSRQRRRRC